MKKLLLMVAVGFLGQSTLISAATDWTPYLKPMLSGCDSIRIAEGIPKKYKASIASKKVKGNPDNEGEEIITTYTLKNATAFGQPLAKVEYLQGYEWSSTSLYFKDNKFMALRPQFKIVKPVDDAKIVKNDASSYELEMGGYLYLKFDKKDKSITCGSGI